MNPGSVVCKLCRSEGLLRVPVLSYNPWSIVKSEHFLSGIQAWFIDLYTPSCVNTPPIRKGNGGIAPRILKRGEVQNIFLFSTEVLLPAQTHIQ
jgi:hypothetical protein